MKQFLFKALFATSLFISFKTIHAQCSLDQVGAPNYSTTCTLSDMAVSPISNVLYTISFNTGVGNKFFLHSATVASSWTPVASLSGTTSIKPVININKSGKVYIAIKDDAAGQVGKLFYESAGSFIQVGTAFSGSNKVSDLSIAFNSLGEEYVAYTDVTNGNLSTVKKWNGSSWVAVGSGTVSSGAAYYNSLIIDKTDSPVLVFEDMSAGNKATVMKFNGTTWNSMISLGTNPTNTKIKLGQNGDYYVGYTESTGNVVVQKFNGSVWTALGSPVTAMSFSANTFDLDIDPNDLPYFICQNNTSLYAAAFKYTGVPTWSNVIGANLTSVTSNNLNIAIDKMGSPFFFYVDQPGNNGLNVKTITSPISISSQPLSVTRCNSQSGSFSVGTVGGAPTSYQWQTFGAGTFTNSSAPYSNATTNSLSFTANTSMNQNQIRCVVNVGCKNIISNTATLTVSTLSTTSSFTNPTCFNSGDGAISVTVNGGTTPYSYTWSPVGGNTPNPTGLYWNTYTLNATDINGCSVTNTFTLTSPPSINTSFSGNMNICSGSNTSLTITATGGTPGYTYSWTPGGSLSSTTSSVVTASPGTTQTYNVTVTDGIGCTATNTVMVNVNTVPTITSSSSPSIICSGNASNLSVSGIGADTYIWMPGGMTSTTTVVSPTTTTIYTVTGTSTLTGCSATNTVALTVNPLPTVSAGPSRTLTCINTSTTLAGSTTGGVTYSWIGPGIVSGATTLNPTINAPGTYDLTVTSTAGCSAGPSPVTVFQNTTPPSPTASSSGTITCTTSTVALTGGPASGVTYQWSGPGFSGGTTSQNAVANAAGTFTLKVTDAVNGCTNTAVTSVSQNTTTPTVSASTTTSSICTGATTTLSATGVGVNTYVWNPGNLSGATQVLAPASTTIYTVTGTNTLTGCTAVANVTITVNPLPTITAGATKSLTCASSFTTVTCSSVGGTSYNWTGPGIVSGYTTVSCNVNAAGTYTVFAISAYGCNSTNTTVLVVSNNTPPVATASSSGTITCVTPTVALTGGPATGVTYQWSGPGFSSGTTAQNADANAAGTFTLKVTSSANSCTNAAVTTVTQNTVIPSPSATTTGTLTCSTTTVALNGGPGTGVSYLWTGPGVSGSPTTQNTTANAAGSYTLNVTSSINGCTNTAVTSVTQNTTAPSPTASTSGTLTCATTTIALNGGPASGVNYLWSGPGVSGSTTTQNTSANAPGIYTLNVVSGTNGCSSSATTAVTQNIVPPVASATNSGTLTCSVSTVNLSGTGGGTYSWNGPGIVSGGTTANPIVNQPGCYTVVVTAANGCTATANTCVAQNTLAPATTTNVSGTLNCTLTSVNASASTAASPVTYNWTGAGITSATTISTITVNAGGIKNYTVTNTANGCVTTGSLNVSQNLLAPSPSASSTGTITCVTNTVQLSGTPAAGVTYTWSAPGGSSILSGINSQNAIGNGAGTYTLTVTMISSACFNSATVAVSQNTALPFANAGMDQSITCVSPTVTLNGSATPSSCTPVWTGGVASGANSYTATATAIGDYTLSVTNPANGCTSTDVVQVTANAGVPSLSTSVTNTLDCASTSATVIATTTVTTVMYSWTGPSIVSGGTTANATVNQPGTYSVTVTNTMTGCSATSNILVSQDITLPNITITSSPSVICSGNSSTLTANGAVTYTWNTAQNTSSISVSPSSTNSYTVNGTGLNGCTNYTVETITVNATPTLAITGNTNICKGSTTLLTGSGATSYTWDSGANTTSVSVTPTVTTTYTLTGDNGNGCTNILPVTVSIIPNKSITGVITSTNGATGGDIIIYKYTAALSHWDSLTITPIGGTYSFNNIDSGQYVLRALPTATNIQVTYAPNSISWQGASVINHGCTSNTSQNIDLIGFAPYVVGPGVLTGHIEEAFGYVPKMNNESKPLVPGTPIGGIIVKGGKNPGGQMFVQTLTDAAGNYTLTGLPINTLPDDYFIFVDIPGLDTNSTYYHISVSGSTPITGFDFNVDAQYINPIGSVTGISKDQSVLENRIILFPNPAKQNAYIQYELTQSANVQIELYDILGNKVKMISENTLEEKDKHTHTINTDHLSSGIYFVKLSINNSNTTIKLIINP